MAIYSFKVGSKPRIFFEKYFYIIFYIISG